MKNGHRWNGATATKRCMTRHKKIVDLLVTLKARSDYRAIFNFANGVLNLAIFRSSIGQEESAKDLQKRLQKALTKIASGSQDRPLTATELSLSEDNTNTKPTADDVARKDNTP